MATLQLQITGIAAAFLILLIFQTVTLVSDRMALTNALAVQENNLQQSVKARQQIDAIATGIAKLAEEGDASAKAIIDDLRRQGVGLRNTQNPTAQ